MFGAVVIGSLHGQPDRRPTVDAGVDFCTLPTTEHTSPKTALRCADA